MANLTVIQGDDRGKVFDLRGSRIVLGRDPQCEVSLTDHSVSRHHAELRIEEGKFHLIDHASSNGTFVNGERIDEAVVRPGDQIRVGAVILTLGRVVTQPRLTSGGPVYIDEAGNVVDAAIQATARSEFDPLVALTEREDQASQRRAAENLKVLFEFSTTLGAILNTQQLCDAILDMVFEVVDADRAFILLHDEASGSIVPKAVRFRDDLIGEIEAERGSGQKQAEGEQPKQPILVSRTIVNYCLDHGEGVLATNAMQDRRFEQGDSVQDLGIRSAICVPIKARDRRLGVLHVDTQIQQRPFTEVDLRMMTSVGYLAGLALENTQLVESALRNERLAAVGEAVASLSHYIKNILQGLQGGASVIETALKADDLGRIRRGWEIVRRNQTRINDLVLDMLHYSRKREPVRQQQNVNAVLREVIELAAPRAAEKQAEVVSRLDPGLPEIWIDPNGIHHACLNIVANAIDAVERRTGRVTVSTSVEEAGSGRRRDRRRQFVITVADNGVGIAEEDLQRIFQAFHSTKGHQGTGLGLAVSQKIIHEHGGTIEVESHVGGGSTFTIRLPIVEPPVAAAATGPEDESEKTRLG
ncbi:MAG: FHA domain-containing protein [Phycisphaerae bacterium]|nr:FHA domain-containing protein [Phycisphaerae bacterium]